EASRHDNSEPSRAWRVKCGDRSIACAHEAVIPAARVLVESRDHPGRVNGPASGLAWIVRTIEAGERTLRCAHKTMRQLLSVFIESRDRAGGVDRRSRGS